MAGNCAKYLRSLDRLEETIIATLIAAATLLMFVAVVQRYGVSQRGRISPAGRRRTGSTGWPRRRQGPLSHPQLRAPHVGAGARHLHDDLDGEVRRRLRRAHRHPRRRRRARRAPAAAAAARRSSYCALLAGALFTGHRRYARRRASLSHRRDGPDLGRARAADVGRLSRRAARLLPHVLPLPAGGVDDSPRPASCRRTIRGTSRALRPRRKGPSDERAHHLRATRSLLLLTGMPVSIALGLTVLTFLFTMT